jgi:SAM-dependent methyltransferase
MACAWVEVHPDNRAFGVDIELEPLEWGRKHNVALLTPEQSARLELIQGDVLEDDDLPIPDVISAFNFSYFCFHERAVLRRYFEKSLARLGPEGILVLDLYGGAEAQRIQTETREEDGFDYVWDQDVFDPIQHGVTNYIHFEFSDGSKIRKAFTYHWRLWTIPELRDLLEEVGFGLVEVYWEGTETSSGEGNGIYRPAKKAVDDPAWVTYIVAAK